jgi:transcription initiation factor IIE alpha subunit
MKAKSVGAVPLSNVWSGHYMTDMEKTATAAIALGTVSTEAISDLTGLKKNKVKTLLAILEETGWDIAVALERQSGDRADNLTINQETYPILRMKGVVA